MKPILIVCLAVAALLLIRLLVRKFEQHQMYYPIRGLEATPGEAGMAYEDVFLNPGDGVRIHGWWVPAEADRGTVLFCHGNAGNISHRLESIAVFHRLGLNVLIFDYRGFGRSEGSPDEEGTYLDAEAAYRHLREEKGIDPERIVIFGRSLGGAVAIELALRARAGALVAESTFTSAVEMGKLIFPFLPIRLLIRNRYDSLAKVGELQLPSLFIHSPGDELVPFEMGERLFQTAAEPKEFFRISGGHGDGFLITGPSYVEGIDSFLKKIGLE
ncbi:MAG: alpha/beta hydrolase [Candidatus Erginobacter occultus]|nr:alpha/beta hydrolase [Candidatus Erginobacter occultus]